MMRLGVIFWSFSLFLGPFKPYPSLKDTPVPGCHEMLAYYRDGPKPIVMYSWAAFW